MAPIPPVVRSIVFVVGPQIMVPANSMGWPRRPLIISPVMAFVAVLMSMVPLQAMVQRASVLAVSPMPVAVWLASMVQDILMEAVKVSGPIQSIDDVWLSIAFVIGLIVIEAEQSMMLVTFADDIPPMPGSRWFVAATHCMDMTPVTCVAPIPAPSTMPLVIELAKDAMVIVPEQFMVGDPLLGCMSPMLPPS